MYWGKFKKSPKNASRLRFYKVCIFTPPNFDWFGQICSAKNFYFWEMTSPFYNFPNCLTYQRMFWDHNPSKKEHIRKVAIFPSKTQFFLSLTKLKSMAILSLSWRGLTNSIKYILQLICVKKDCFYPILVLEMKFLNFWVISQRPKNWFKKKHFS